VTWWFVGDSEGHQNFLIGNGLRGPHQSNMISALFAGPGFLRTIFSESISIIRLVILKIYPRFIFMCCLQNCRPRLAFRAKTVDFDKKTSKKVGCLGYYLLSDGYNRTDSEHRVSLQSSWIESGGVSIVDETTEALTIQPIRVKDKRANEIPYLIIQP